MKKTSIIIFLMLNTLLTFSQSKEKKLGSSMEILERLKNKENFSLKDINSKIIPSLIDLLYKELKISEDQNYLETLVNFAVNIDRVANSDTTNSKKIVDLLVYSLLSKNCRKCKEAQNLLSYNKSFLTTESRTLLKTYIEKNILSTANLKLIAAFDYTEYYDTIYQTVFNNKILEKNPNYLDENFFYASDYTMLLVLAKFGNERCDKKYVEIFETKSEIVKKGIMSSFSFMKTPESIKTLISYLNKPGDVQFIDDYYDVPLNRHALKELVLIFKQVKIPNAFKELNIDIRSDAMLPTFITREQIEAAQKIFNDKEFLKTNNINFSKDK